MIGEMNLNPDEVFLAQGTLRPDLIESASHLASGKAEVIKTHHNDTELIRKLRDEVPDFFTDIIVQNNHHSLFLLSSSALFLTPVQHSQFC